MYLSRIKLGNLYQKQLLNEMDSRIMDYVMERVNGSRFESVFGSDPDINRIVIKLPADPNIEEIEKLLDMHMNGFGGVDWETGMVHRKIMTKMGEKVQQIKLGTVLNKLDIDPKEKKKFMEWVALYNGKYTESDYSIILSRHPIDVLRMEDHSNFKSSCHSTQGSYFQCAVNDAINGGGIAYIVKNKELEEFLEEGDIQDDDIFEDDDRYDYEGMISPIARLRLKRLYNKAQDTDLAIPERSIYGKSIPNFYNTVRDYLLKHQSNITKDMVIDNQKDWTLKGGTYSDSSISNLVGYYFKDEDYITNKNIVVHHEPGSHSMEHEISRDVDDIVSTLREEADDYITDANRYLTYCNVDWEYQFSDGDRWVDLMPSGEIDLTNILSPEEIAQIGDYVSDHSGAFNEDGWSVIISHFDDNSNNLFHHNEDLSFTFVDGTLEFAMKYQTEFSIYDIEEFLSNLREFDDFLGSIEWKELFVESGLLVNERLVYYRNYLENNIKNDNFIKIEDEDYYNNMVSIEFVVPNHKQSESLYNTNENRFAARIWEVIMDYTKNNFQIPEEDSSGQLHYTPFLESFMMTGLSPKAGNIQNQLNISDVRFYTHGLKGSAITFDVDVEEFDSVNVFFFLFIDKHYSKIQSLIIDIQ